MPIIPKKIIYGIYPRGEALKIPPLNYRPSASPSTLATLITAIQSIIIIIIIICNSKFVMLKAYKVLMFDEHFV